MINLQINNNPSMTRSGGIVSTHPAAKEEEEGSKTTTILLEGPHQSTLKVSELVEKNDDSLQRHSNHSAVLPNQQNEDHPPGSGDNIGVTTTAEGLRSNDPTVAVIRPPKLQNTTTSNSSAAVVSTENNCSSSSWNRLLESPERRMTFLDAAVAIALTLLILPLMESATEIVADNQKEGDDESMMPSLQEWFADNASVFLTFLLSFAVISNEWGDHARFLANMEYLTTSMSKVLWIWLLLIVFMPLTTVLNTASFQQDNKNTLALQHAIYIGNIALLKVANILLVLLVRNNMQETYQPEKADCTAEFLSSMIIDTVILAIAIPLSLTPIKYYSLLFLILTPWLTKLWMRSPPMCRIPPARR
jgi:uncharacterized membrane protein